MAMCLITYTSYLEVILMYTFSDNSSGKFHVCSEGIFCLSRTSWNEFFIRWIWKKSI